MIDSKEVETIFLDCLFKPEEVPDNIPPDNAVTVEGIVSKFAFNPERLKNHERRIVELLNELPVQFRKESGGGWSFLNACNTKDGVQWTGLHQRMEQLFALGMAIGKARYVLPREIWQALPGGMPYIVLTL